MEVESVKTSLLFFIFFWSFFKLLYKFFISIPSKERLLYRSEKNRNKLRTKETRDKLKMKYLIYGKGSHKTILYVQMTPTHHLERGKVLSKFLCDISS